jgi:FixJ family two-component response regulator
MNRTGVVYLLDDEPAMLRALARVLGARGIETIAFSDPEEFLAAEFDGRPACLVVDLAMPRLDGFEVQEHLARRGDSLPVIFLTGHGDIRASVRSMKAGAHDFLTKPVVAEELLAAVQSALETSCVQQQADLEIADLRRRLENLTPRQREVFRYVIAGKINKAIAAELGTGEQNVKVHRRRVMRKMGAGSLAELVRIAQTLGIDPAD